MSMAERDPATYVGTCCEQVKVKSVMNYIRTAEVMMER